MKNKSILIGIVLIAIFVMCMNSQAYAVDIVEINYPNTVREGDILHITVVFDYTEVTAELYGGSIELNYYLIYIICIYNII